MVLEESKSILEGGMATNSRQEGRNRLAESSHFEPQHESERANELSVEALHSQRLPFSKSSSFRRQHPLNFPKQCHQLGTGSPNA